MMARLVSEKEAAEYIGVDLSLVRAWVASGRLPKPLPECNKFDLKAIDAYLDRVSGLSAAESRTNPLDAWRDRRRED
jgi:hypothetical protein